jgi:hypothetical protein
LPLKSWQEAIIAVGGVAGAVGIGYYAVTKLLAPPCAPGSACYVAAQPYIEGYQICANNYASALKQYLAEDNANGTGLTQDQINNLNYLSTCMNQNAQQIASTAKQYNVDPIATVLFWGGVVISVALAYVGLKLFKTEIVTLVRMGATGASKLFHTIVRAGVADGEINNASTANALINQLPDIENSTASLDATALNNLAQEEVITAEEAQNIISEDETALGEDETVTADVLQGVAS